MAAVLEKQARRWTYEEYCRLDDDQRHEIIDGNLLMAPSPDMWHQDWIGELYMILRNHVHRQNLGKVFVAPFDVVLDPTNVVQPDLIFVAAAVITPTGDMVTQAIFAAPMIGLYVLSILIAWIFGKTRMTPDEDSR